MKVNTRLKRAWVLSGAWAMLLPASAEENKAPPEKPAEAVVERILPGETPPPDPDRPDVKILREAGEAYDDGKLALRMKYRQRLAEAVRHADRAEVMRLDGMGLDSGVPEGKKREDYFPILPYKRFAEIRQRKVLTGEALEKCRTATAELLSETDGGGALCHYPIHAIRLMRGDEVIFQTSICWECVNFYIRFPDDGDSASWEGLSGKALRELLIAEMPIPTKEAGETKAPPAAPPAR